MVKILLESIPSEGLVVDLCAETRLISELNELFDGDELVFFDPLSVRLTLNRREETVEVVGHVGAGIRTTCCRCLETFDGTIEEDVSILFTPDVPESGAQGEVVELNDKLARTERLCGDTIDLEKSIREHLIMALPVQPICRAGCKGLCHCCGENLNRRSCTCRPADDTGPFAVLKKMKLSGTK